VSTRLAKPSILVMAGGTGGHIFPGLAVAENLRSKGWDVAWLGNPQGMEYQLVPSKGFRFESVRFGGLRGKGLQTKMMLPINLIRAVFQSWRIMQRLKPSVVLGMGGYISVPGGLVSFLQSRPLVLHESNSVAGSANRFLARFARRVLTGFPEVMINSEWVGNPIRESFEMLADPLARYSQRQGNLRLLVVGGSLGAAVLNEMIPKALALIPAEQRPSVIHQAGEKHLEQLRKNYSQSGVQAEMKAFITDMAEAYANADLVICRSGAMTVSEIAASGVAACFVPFPHAIDDHQTANARFLSNAKAAILLPQADLSADRIATLLQRLTRIELQQYAHKAHQLAKLHATQRVSEICAEAAQ